MLFRLTIVEGERKGEQFVVKDEILIGRTKGDLALKDHRASNPHARIYSGDNNTIEVEDLDSTNGTLVNGKKVKKATLQIGDEVVIGRTKFQVQEHNDTITRENIEKGTWQEDLNKALSTALKTAEKPFPFSTQAIGEFSPPISLEVIRGGQKGVQFIYGFGPRSVGSQCIDGLTNEESLLPTCFELQPINGNCKLVSKDKNLLVNGKYEQSVVLQPGDQISIGDTVFEFQVVDDS